MRKRATKEEMRTRTSKRCGACNHTKPLKEFHRSSRSGDGYRTVCKQCRKTESGRGSHWQERYARHRAFMDEQKNIPCADCGGEFHPAVMHFHHLGNKEIEVAKLVNRPIAIIEREIAKCVVLCANCHIMRHVNEREQVPEFMGV